jgi:ATP-dependent exoDNAse (exonuclease V) beta subunit
MTGHASKGLEYAHTYFLGAEQGSFFRDSDPDESVISEEERLFYVGTTRHKESLQITRCNTRFVNGETKCFEPLEMLTRLAGTVDNFDWTIKGKENTARSRDSKRHQAPSNNISSNSSEASKKLRTALNQSHSKNEAGTTSGSQEKEGEMSSSDSFKAKIEQKKIKNHNKLNPDDESIIEDHSITNGLLFTL